MPPCDSQDFLGRNADKQEGRDGVPVTGLRTRERVIQQLGINELSNVVALFGKNERRPSPRNF